MNKSLLWTVLIVIFIAVGGSIYYFASKDADYSSNTNSVYSNSNTTVNSAKNTNTTVVTNTTNLNSDLNTNTANTNLSINQNTNTAPTTASVNASSSGFSPASVTVAVGGRVTWTNNGGGTVYVAPDNHPSHLKYGSLWPDTGAGEISSGENYSFIFTQAGTYTYHDHNNASSTGTIIVK